MAKEDSKEDSKTEESKKMSAKNLLKSEKETDVIAGALRFAKDKLKTEDTAQKLSNQTSKATLKIRSGEADKDKIKEAKKLAVDCWADIIGEDVKDLKKVQKFYDYCVENFASTKESYTPPTSLF